MEQTRRRSGGGILDTGATLSASVLDSDANAFSATSRVRKSSEDQLIVAAAVLDSDGNSFTIFS